MAEDDLEALRLALRDAHEQRDAAQEAVRQAQEALTAALEAVARADVALKNAETEALAAAQSASSRQQGSAGVE